MLNDLDQDVQLCRDRVDWVAKKQLLEALLNEEQLSWTDPWLQSIDLEYHNIAPEAGLYYELLRPGDDGPLCDRSRDQARHLLPP